MSLDSWCEEFYPTPANTVAEEDAVAHSLRKWIGLRPDNLRKHGVFLEDRSVWEHGAVVNDDAVKSLEINARSCALCELYLEDGDCARCPLAIARGNVPCDDTMRDERQSPWGAASGYHPDPEPMILWLQRTLETEP